MTAKNLVRTMALWWALSAIAAAAAQHAKPAIDCAAPTTQADMAHCAYDSFLQAGAAESAQYKALAGALPKAQADLLRRAQTAWRRYQKAACDLDSSASAGGSTQSTVFWSCMARLTRERTEQLARLGACVEGDVACVRLKR